MEEHLFHIKNDTLSKIPYLPPINCLSVTSKTDPRRFDFVSSGPKMRKLRVFSFSTITSFKNCPNIVQSDALIVPRFGSAIPNFVKLGRTRGLNAGFVYGLLYNIHKVSKIWFGQDTYNKV